VLHTDHVYPAYQIYIGANYILTPQLAQSIGSIAAYDTPKFVVDLVHKFEEVAEAAEALGAEINLGKWLRSDAGRKAATAIAGRYGRVPLFSEDKNYYFDWGSDEVFNVTKRGKPECSAGLFDMITVDQNEIAEARKRAESGDAKAAYHIIFHASRMLLVTRGLDPQDAAGVFDAFVENFINQGYVASHYTAIISQAKQEGAEGSYDLVQVNALADAVNALYESMDDALQFKKPEQPQTAEVEEKKDTQHPISHNAIVEATRSKDLRGVLCPMNFVRTKLELATLQSGDILEILLDDGVGHARVFGV
jgi:sulfite reductase (ferredoxin)